MGRRERVAGKVVGGRAHGAARLDITLKASAATPNVSPRCLLYKKTTGLGVSGPSGLFSVIPSLASLASFLPFRDGFPRNATDFRSSVDGSFLHARTEETSIAQSRAWWESHPLELEAHGRLANGPMDHPGRQAAVMELKHPLRLRSASDLHWWLAQIRQYSESRIGTRVKEAQFKEAARVCLVELKRRPVHWHESPRVAASSSCVRLHLNHDEWGIVAHALHDPLRPLLAVNLGRAAKDLQLAMQAMPSQLKRQRQDVEALATRACTGTSTCPEEEPEGSAAHLRDARCMLLGHRE